MIVADYILQRIVKAGITHAFGVYGASCAHLFDAFHRVNGITVIPTAHEQGASFMAEGYAKAKGPFGVCITTGGPGALNAATGVANAYYDSVPVLFLCGQVSTKVMRSSFSGLRQRGFQEAPIAEIFKSISKYCVEIHRVYDVRDCIESAIELMLRGRPGPAVLSLPLDILASEVPPVWPERLWPTADNTPSIPNVTDCLGALLVSKRPVIIAGGGTLKCASELRFFAERYQVPVFTTWNAIEVIPDDWCLFGGRIGTYGGKGRNFAVQQADFVLALGCRFSGRITGGDTKSFLRGARTGHGIWHVDVDKGVLAAIEPDVPHRHRIHTCVEAFLRAARGVMPLQPSASGDGQWLRDVSRWRDVYDPVKRWEGVIVSRCPECSAVGKSNELTSAVHTPLCRYKSKYLQGIKGVNPYMFIRELSRNAPEDAIVVSDCGGNAVITHHAWEAKLGQRIFSNHGNSPMGGAMGYAVGAAIAQPDRSVICIIGDGGFALGANELNTIRIQKNSLKNLRIFVINNAIYGITRAWQVENLQGRVSACGPGAASGYEAPNVGAVASGYNIDCTSIISQNMADVSYYIKRALDGNTPLIVDVYCPDWAIYEPRITGWDRPIEEMLPSLPEEEFLAQMKYVEPVSGWKERRR